MPDGYTVTTDKEITQKVNANKTTQYNYVVDKLGSLIINVYDEKTNELVPGADVSVKDYDGNVIATGTTDKDGKVELDKLPVGEYVVVINKVPDGYTVTTDKEIKKSVEANAKTEYEFKIDKNVTPNPGSTPAPTPTPTPSTTTQVISSPKTGETTSVFLYIMLFACIGSVICYRKKKQEM